MLFNLSPLESRPSTTRYCLVLGIDTDKCFIRLITHWRDVVRHMKDLQRSRLSTGTLNETNLISLKFIYYLVLLLPKFELTIRRLGEKSGFGPLKQQVLRPSASESFALRKPPDWKIGPQADRAHSPTPTREPN